MPVDDDLAADAAAHLKEGKFLHLLKPIRDLADNWNVDIANELEEYLSHLDRTGFSFDDGPSLDFAEAALVIQSSACVYSKKVEYLHTLVYQALDAVRTKRRKDDHAPEGQEGHAAGNDDTAAGMPGHKAKSGRRHGQAEEDDSLEAFLASGWDLVDSGKDIDLEEDPEAAAPAYTRPPATLLAMDEHLDGQQGDSDAGVYRLARCHVHISGALMLDATDALLYDQSLRPSKQSSQAAVAARAMQLGVVGIAGGTAAQAEGLGPQVQGTGAEGEDAEDDDPGNMAGGFGDDDSDGDAAMPDVTAAAAAAGPAGAEAGAAAAADAAMGDAPEQPQVPDAGADQGAAAAAAAAAAADRVTRGRMQAVDGDDDDAGPGPGQGNAEPEEEEVFDPYKPLDPQDPGDLPLKPMQVRKPGKLKKGVLFARKGRAGWDALFPLAGSAVPPVLAGLVHQEFAYAAELLQPAARQQHRGAAAAAAATARRGQGLAQQLRRAGAVDAGLLDGWGQAAAGTGAEPGLYVVGEDGDDGDEAAGAWPDAAGFGDDDDGGADGEAAAGGDWADVGAADVMEGMQGPQAQLRLLELCGPGAGDEGAADDQRQSYEDLCRSHIDSMLAAASARQVVTELAQRVGDWRSRIDPLLRAEETRGCFDLQSYGERILGKLVREKTTTSATGSVTVLSFQHVAQAATRHEVSRSFAAMLQLINNRNVALHQDGGPDAPFSLQLLTEVQPHKQMADKMRKGRQPALPSASGLGCEGPTGSQGEEGVSQGESEADEENVDMNVQQSPQAGSALEEGNAGKGKGKVAAGKQRAPRAPQAKKARAET